MIINNGSSNYEFNELNINYIYLQASTLSIRTKDDVLTPIVFTDNDTLNIAIDIFIKRMHSKLATLGGLKSGTGVIYWINTKNVTTNIRTLAEIDISFSSGSPLNVELINEDEAVNHFDYLEFKWRCNHISTVFSGRTIHKVNPAYTTDIDELEYSTYSEAIAEAVSGDVIYFEDTTIELTTERYDLKDGVDIYFQDTIVRINQAVPFLNRAGLSVSNKPLFCDLDGDAVVNIYGSLHFQMNTNTRGWLLIDTFYPDTVINLQFFKLTRTMDIASGEVSSHIHSNNGKIRATGYISEKSRTYDDDTNYMDGSPAIFDSDVLLNHNRTEEDDLKLFFPFDEDFMIYYLRNGYYEGELNFDSNEDTSYNFINAKLKVSPMILGSVSIEATRLWRAQFEIISNSPPFTDITGEFPENQIESYNKSYHNYSGGLGMPEDYSAGEEAEYINSFTVSEGISAESFGDIQHLYIDYSGSNLILTMPAVHRAKFYEIYKNESYLETVEVLPYEDFTFTTPISYLPAKFKVRASDGESYTAFSNKINSITMALTNKPSKPKYSVNDNVYIVSGQTIIPVMINRIEITVTNPLGDSTGVQKNIYGFVETAESRPEHQVYSSPNHALSMLKKDYLNSFGIDVLSQFVPSYDMAGLDLTAYNFLTDDWLDFQDCFMDNTNLHSATLPSATPNLATFKTKVASYDKETTIWTDGVKIGER